MLPELNSQQAQFDRNYVLRTSLTNRAKLWMSFCFRYIDITFSPLGPRISVQFARRVLGWCWWVHQRVEKWWNRTRFHYWKKKNLPFLALEEEKRTMHKAPLSKAAYCRMLTFRTKWKFQLVSAARASRSALQRRVLIPLHHCWLWNESLAFGEIRKLLIRCFNECSFGNFAACWRLLGKIVFLFYAFWSLIVC